MDARLISIMAGGIMALACVLLIVTTALPSWVKADIQIATAEFGLWQYCVSALGQRQCDSLPDCSASGCGKLNGARAFMILSVLLSFVATSSLLATLMPNFSSNKGIRLIGVALAASSLLCGVVGIALGISFYSEGNGKLAVASFLGFATLVINLVGAIAAAASFRLASA